MKVWGYTDVGRVRQSNQDAYYMEIIGGKQAICVVCDGMGGAKAGNIASKLATDAFVRHVKSILKPGMHCESLKEMVSDSVFTANRSVHEMAASDASYDGMGTTLVSVLAAEDGLVVINIGDSRAYLLDKEGIRRITRDHSLVEDMVEMGEITVEEAKEHPGKNLITRAIGTDEEGERAYLHPPARARLLRAIMHRRADQPGVGSGRSSTR